MDRSVVQPKHLQEETSSSEGDKEVEVSITFLCPYEGKMKKDILEMKKPEACAGAKKRVKWLLVEKLKETLSILPENAILNILLYPNASAKTTPHLEAPLEEAIESLDENSKIRINYRKDALMRTSDVARRHITGGRQPGCGTVNEEVRTLQFNSWDETTEEYNLVIDDVICHGDSSIATLKVVPNVNEFCAVSAGKTFMSNYDEKSKTTKDQCHAVLSMSARISVLGPEMLSIIRQLYTKKGGNQDLNEKEKANLESRLKVLEAEVVPRWAALETAFGMDSPAETRPDTVEEDAWIIAGAMMNDTGSGASAMKHMSRLHWANLIARHVTDSTQQMIAKFYANEGGGEEYHVKYVASMYAVDVENALKETSDPRDLTNEEFQEHTGNECYVNMIDRSTEDKDGNLSSSLFNHTYVGAAIYVWDKKKNLYCAASMRQEVHRGVREGVRSTGMQQLYESYPNSVRTICVPTEDVMETEVMLGFLFQSNKKRREQHKLGGGININPPGKLSAGTLNIIEQAILCAKLPPHLYFPTLRTVCAANYIPSATAYLTIIGES